MEKNWFILASFSPLYSAEHRSHVSLPVVVHSVLSTYLKYRETSSRAEACNTNYSPVGVSLWLQTLDYKLVLARFSGKEGKINAYYLSYLVDLKCIFTAKHNRFWATLYDQNRGILVSWLENVGGICNTLIFWGRVAVSLCQHRQLKNT